MATEVFLMTDVPDLGAEGEVVTVADGYARNYLVPKKLAAAVTEATRRRLGKIREERKTAHEAELAAAQELAKKLATVSCTILAKTSKEEKLYGSVLPADIVEALKSHGIENVEKQHLVLDEPIRELGVFDVPVKLHPEVETTVKVWVVEE